ncbi:MAG: glycosyltransferase [Roseitalea sp.]|jgi:glycosyltransferase involved in cell wall biosynthesis|nr:glycosyltransferase [Roseitalea sp.]MBO6722772.1 glycosyltransferase [Roseitalea sp.]MBO6745154.1 glycosyltransferase [Roseitalea sp.]
MRRSNQPTVPLSAGARAGEENSSTENGNWLESSASDQDIRTPDSAVHFTTVHGNRDVRIFVKQCRSLARSGIQVTMIAPGSADEDERVDGVICRHVNVPRNRLGRVVVGQLRVLVRLLKTRAAIYHYHDPELLPVALVLRMTGRTVVYDAHEELSTDVLDKPWIPAFLRPMVAKLAGAIEWTTGRFMNAIIVATPGIAPCYPSSKVALVRNYPPHEEISGSDGDHDATGADEDEGAVFVGLLNAIRGGYVLAQAMQQTQHENASLTVIGAVDDPALREAFASAVSRGSVSLEGWLARPEAMASMHRARVGILLYQPVQHHLISLPNKLFEYMAAGIPVIASDFPQWREILEEVECGIIVDPEDAVAVAAAIDWIYAHPDEAQAMGQRGRNAVLDRFNWNSEFRTLLGLYQALESKHPNAEHVPRRAN